jgi:GTPase SAR1 family protein
MIIQPARKSYYFEKGYADLFNTIKGAWANNKQSAIHYWSELMNKYNDSNIGGLNKLFYVVMYGIAAISVVIIGTIVTLLISFLHIIILLCFMISIYIAYSIIWGIDRLYLIRNRIFSPCTVCTKSSAYLIPTYLCPGCGKEHTRLTPGVYGILKRECICGTIIPTTFFNGRRDLKAICPNPDCKAPIYGKESKPICIAIVGGPAVGKTIFITAFVKQFAESIVPARNWEIEHYSPEKQKLFENIINNYSQGNARKTTDKSAISVNFFLKSKDNSWNPHKLFFIYDIAGEVFGGETEDRLQKQYQYCHGIVFLIDPFSSPDVMNEYASKILPVDMAQISHTNPNEALDIFIQKLQDIAGLSPSSLSKVPIAVVINKTDIGGLQKIFEKTALAQIIARDPKKRVTERDAEDIACREFLRQNDMGNLVKTIELKFKTNKFFACSALGHSIGQGPMRPSHVMVPMKWLLSLIDRDIAKG